VGSAWHILQGPCPSAWDHHAARNHTSHAQTLTLASPWFSPYRGATGPWTLRVTAVARPAISTPHTPQAHLQRAALHSVTSRICTSRPWVSSRERNPASRDATYTEHVHVEEHAGRQAAAVSRLTTLSYRSRLVAARRPPSFLDRPSHPSISMRCSSFEVPDYSQSAHWPTRGVESRPGHGVNVNTDHCLNTARL
jgi:hypothetical protein